MPKLNIYVSNDLKHEMDKYPDQHWSMIAQHAFRNVIHEIRSKADGKYGKGGITYMDEKGVVELMRLALDSLEFGRKERAAKRRAKKAPINRERKVSNAN